MTVWEKIIWWIRNKQWEILYLSIAILAVLLCSIFASCTRKVYVPVTTERTIIEVRHDTIVDVQIQREQVFVQYPDTVAEAHTSLADAIAVWNGATGLLSLNLVQKDTVLPVKVQYIERVVTEKSENTEAAAAITELNKELAVLNAKNKSLTLRLWLSYAIIGLAIAIVAIVWFVRRVRK